MRDILDFIRPPEDADWKHINRWRWNVCLTLSVLVLSMGWAFSPKGFAWSNEVDSKIAATVEAKIKPIAEAQKQQGDKLDRMSKLLIDQLAASKAAEIRLNISKRCKTENFADRETLAREKDRLQGEYRGYVGEYYREPSCGEL